MSREVEELFDRRSRQVVLRVVDPMNPDHDPEDHAVLTNARHSEVTKLEGVWVEAKGYNELKGIQE